MTSYTPGPWKVETRQHVHAITCNPTRPNEWPEVAFIEVNGQPDCGSITARARTNAELMANARLIAAAPRLAALARATDAQLTMLLPYLREPYAESARALRDEARAALVEAGL